MKDGGEKMCLTKGSEKIFNKSKLNRSSFQLFYMNEIVIN